jgi:3'-phosphoadenosine 5'-phosphosulfate sulfotransferase (PAPS reductase)/FAD synthetase
MIFDFLNGRPLVANISGGKDSTAMALFFIENNLDFDPIFCDTGWEHEETYAYLDYLETVVLKKPIKRLRNEKYFTSENGGYQELVRKNIFFPSNVIRSCTLELKVDPQLDYMDEVRASTKKKPISAVGIRKEESQARSVLSEFEEKDESTIWRPLINFTFQQVVDIHKRHNVTPNPLYTRGFSRVGCFPCIFARKGEIKHAYQEKPERFDTIRNLEKEVKELAKEKGRKDATYSFFKRGLVDDVLDWALKNEDQLELFDEEYLSGCLTWGLCDSGLKRKVVSTDEYETLKK